MYVLDIYEVYKELQYFTDRRQLNEIGVFISLYNEKEKDVEYCIALYSATVIVLNLPFKVDTDIYWLEKFLGERKIFRKYRKELANSLKQKGCRNLYLESTSYYFLHGYSRNGKYDHFKLINKELLHYYYNKRRYNDAYKILESTSLLKYIKFTFIEGNTDFDEERLIEQLSSYLSSDIDLIIGDGGYWDKQCSELVAMIEETDKNWYPDPYTEYYLPFKEYIVTAMDILAETKYYELLDLFRKLFYLWFNIDDEYTVKAQNIMRNIDNERIIRNLSSKLNVDDIDSMSRDQFLALGERIDQELGALYFDKSKYISKFTDDYKIDISKLDDNTIKNLTTGEFVFELLSKQNDVDFAGAALSWCRAVENELKVTVYDVFVHSLNTNEIKSMFNLSRIQDYFSLGFFPQIIYRYNGLEQLYSYLQSKQLFTGYSIVEFDNFFKDVQYLARTFRNALSHTELISVVDAKLCHDIIMVTKKIIQKCSKISN